MPDDPAARPLAHLAQVLKRYWDLPRLVDAHRERRDSWPDWCFLPLSVWYDLAIGHVIPMGIDPDHLPPHLDIGLSWDKSVLGAIGAWRYTKGVYDVDPTLRSALEQTDIDGALPADVLTRLPEWSIYIATPGMTMSLGELHGVWAHLDYDMDTHRTDLRLLLDTDSTEVPDGLVAYPVHLGPWSLREAMDRVASRALDATGLTELPAGTMDAIIDIVRPIISMILYLCSEAPEISSDRLPGASPSLPRPRRTRRGWRLFAPDNVTIWQVGREIGAQLRHDRAIAHDPTGRTVRPHIRRGHWHLYWTGPRDGNQRAVYHWLPPMVVASD